MAAPRHRRQRRERVGSERSQQNLDPLLDTLANVVGILVMLVGVTQLSLGDAIDRISRSGSVRDVTRIDVEAIEGERADLEAALRNLREEITRRTAKGGRDAWLEPELEALVTRLEALPGPVAESEASPDSLLRRIEDKRHEVAEQAAGVESAQASIGRLAKVVEGLPRETRPKRARLPDPRAPPAGSRPQYILCRYGRLSIPDWRGLATDLREGTRRALGREILQTEDVVWMRNLFSKKGIGRDGLYWSIEQDPSGIPEAQLGWHDKGIGQDLADLSREEGRFRELLSRWNPKRHYLRFFVWPDCFETYLEARYLAEAREYAISWEAVPADRTVSVDLTGRRATAPIRVD